MPKAIRDVYGEALVKYGAENKNVVVLDADVSSSTKSCIFGEEFPERFYNCGISEYAMVCMAGGMAANGKIPFVNTFAVFLSTISSLAVRSFLSYSKMNIKLVGAYGGLSDSYDGASHHSIEDIAIMRAMPNLTVMVASDEVVTDWMIKRAIEVDAPMYIRLARGDHPTFHKPNADFSIGKGVTLREGSDVTIIACGVMVGAAMKAAEMLSADGIQATVVDMFTIKPIDAGLIISCAKKTGAIVTTEEHSVIGGLGGAVAEVLMASDARVPLEMIGIRDCHAESGDYTQLLEKYGLDAPSIVKAAKKAIARA